MPVQNKRSKNNALTIPLERGIDIDALMSGKVTEFEVDSQIDSYMKDLQLDQEGKTYFDNLCKTEYILNNDDDPDDKDDDTSFFQKQRKLMTNLTTDGGVKKLIKKEGVGSVASENARITVHYNGFLEDLDEPFDSTRFRNKPLVFSLGKGAVIWGLELGIKSMKKSEVARFLIDSNYAYGDMGCPPRIPAKACILFEVELIDFSNTSALDEYEDLDEQQKRGLSCDRIVKVTSTINKDGNELYIQGSYKKAIKKYMTAINVAESSTAKNEEEEKRITAVYIKSYHNMAQCHLKLGNFGKAIGAGRKVLEWNPNYPKALYICGKGYRHCGEFSRARKCLESAYTLSPKSKDIHNEIKLLDKAEKEYHAAERLMCQKMMSQ